MYSPSKMIHHEQCAGCLEMYGDHKMILQDNQLYCEECFEDRFTHCDICKEYQSSQGRGNLENICECCQCDLYDANTEAAHLVSRVSIWYEVA